MSRAQASGNKAAQVGYSAAAALAGWGAAVLGTMLIEIPELWRNAPSGARLPLVGEGCALWAAFTLVVCAAVWCVVALPVALLVQPRALLAWRRQLTVICPVAGIWFVGWRLGTWSDLTHQWAENPFGSLLYWNYTLFAACFALVTVRVYTRLLGRRVESHREA